MDARTCHAVLLAITSLVASAVMRAQPQRVAGEPGVAGSVLAPDETPVSAGSVVIESPAGRMSASIDAAGRFHFVPGAPGRHQLTVHVSGLAMLRPLVYVPPAITLPLSAIHMSPCTSLRGRFVSSNGEPVTSPRLRRESFDVYGVPFMDPPGDRPSDEIDGDGTIRIGPLPRGVTTLS